MVILPISDRAGWDCFSTGVRFRWQRLKCCMFHMATTEMLYVSDGNDWNVVCFRWQRLKCCMFQMATTKMLYVSDGNDWNVVYFRWQRLKCCMFRVTRGCYWVMYVLDCAVLVLSDVTCFRSLETDLILTDFTCWVMLHVSDRTRLIDTYWFYLLGDVTCFRSGGTDWYIVMLLVGWCYMFQLSRDWLIVNDVTCRVM